MMMQIPKMTGVPTSITASSTIRTRSRPLLCPSFEKTFSTHDNRTVHHQPNGDGEPAERHQVRREPEWFMTIKVSGAGVPWSPRRSRWTEDLPGRGRGR